MTSEEIYEQLLPIIQTYLPDDVLISAVTLDSDLTAELNINSAHLVDVVLDVVDAFDIELTNSDVELLHSVKDAIEISQNKLSSN